MQALVGKTGKESLKRRCLELKSDSLAANVAKRGKSLLGKFELDDVRDISAGAATFYVWVSHILVCGCVCSGVRWKKEALHVYVISGWFGGGSCDVGLFCVCFVLTDKIQTRKRLKRMQFIRTKRKACCALF